MLGADSTLFIYQLINDSAALLYSTVLTDEVLLLQIGDADNDGENDLVAVTGRKRYQKTEVKVYLIDQEKNEWQIEKLYSKYSARPQATSMIIANYPDEDKQSIIVSYFESKYLVETVVITQNDDSWNSEVLSVKRMAMTRDVGVLDWDKKGDPKAEMAVGRVYGDEIGMLGDACIFGSDNIYLPSKRGVKAVKIGDGDNDRENEIYIGDGWHQDYGKIARGRLAEIDHRNSDITYELIEDVKYQYETSQIEIADINSDGLNEVITRGNRFIRIYQKGKEDWMVFTDSLLPVKQFCIGDVSGDKHPELIFAGPKVKLFNLGNLEFSTDLGEGIVTEPISPDSIIGEAAPELSMLTQVENT